MATKQKLNLTAKLELKVTASQLRGTVDKKKVKSRGPAQIGQLKSSKVIHLGNIAQDELTKRIAMATQILNTGKVPAGEKPQASNRADTTTKTTTKTEPGTKAPEKAKDEAAPVAKAGADKPKVSRKESPKTPEAKKK